MKIPHSSQAKKALAMVRPRELYKGQCLNDLEPFYQLPNLKNNKLASLLSTAQKVYRKAEECYLDGDEELSYIYFMRYFNLIDFIRKMPDYASNKQQVAKSLGHHKQLSDVLDKTEALSNSLKKRYSELSEKNQSMQNEANAQMVGNNHGNGEDMDVSMEEETGLSATELFKAMKDPKTSLLIMDCRPKADFASSRLNYQYCINIPAEIILPGMTAGKIQQQLEASSKGLWSSRMVKDKIVLMDWSTKTAVPILHTPIWRLRDILQNWDPDTTYRSPIKCLIGGYENFILMYPMQCTNPNVQAPVDLAADSNVLDDIEYPSINDITMKDTNKFESTSGQHPSGDVSRPTIDRKSKAAALKTYDEKQKMLDLLQEQEALVEKVLENERKRLEAENDWQSVSKQVKQMDGTDQNEILKSREQELLYNIMQLESKERDYKLENELLLQQVEEYKRREREMNKIVSDTEAETVKKTEQNIEVKLKEAKQIDEQREKITQEREKQLAFAREQKRHLKPPAEEEEISKPKIPQFDRSIKPPTKAETIEVPIQRDFAGVSGGMGRGLTGLKNLGNTCYMNSIMQCLSNTTALVEYFVTHSYRKHINRSNKTQGRIVEEVAALIKVLWNGQYKYISSKDLRYIVGQYQQIFRGIEQQDSHEFLTILMDWLHSDLQTLKIADSPRTNLPASQKAWLEFTKSRESLILRLFYGQIKSTVKCMQCSKESATYECFSNLSLELPQNANRCDLSDCLDMYFNGEKIRGWNCPSCKDKRDAIKKLDISKLPPILVVHFKRFYADSDGLGSTYKKKQSFVNFPLINLNMNSYVARSELRTGGSKMYHLYAVSNHYGSMEGGHYTAFCKSSVYGKWFKFDDQSVSAIDSSEVVSSAAYILFYSCLPEAPQSDVI